MKYINLFGRQTSCLGFGAMRFPTNTDGTINIEKSDELIDRAYNAGVNYFDTSYVYHNGESETFLKHSLSRYPRESYIITNKLPDWCCKTKDDVEKIFNEELERCGVDYFDIYLVHSITNSSFNHIKELEIIEQMIQKKEQGYIKHLGFSFHGNAPLLREILENYNCFEFVQLQINYFDWESEAKELYEIVRSHNLPIIVMEPVRGGLLANLHSANSVFTNYDKTLSVASWALRFVWNLEGVAVVLSGMSTLEQVEDNIKNVSLPQLTTDENKLIWTAFNKFKNSVLIPCTGCRYCMECTVGIQIPDIFKKYNNYILNSHNPSELLNEYDELKGKNNCITCKKCEKHCPQGLSIIKNLIAIDNEVNRLKTQKE